MEVYGLLHDAAEVCVADVPRPMKTAEARALEDRVQLRIYTAQGVP
jgi:5'-deoxynucleotidase YfbR-like HD superfamily hydrolase